MRAALYCRLSKEDGGGKAESESIANQKILLRNYAADQGWEVVSVYCDEDRSGMDRDRPGFLQLIDDARRGFFDVIVVKTMSRFTRDMELVERYIHGDFVRWGVRFVAVVDNLDTQQKGNKKARQINGLINEWYLEDLSDNIRAVLQEKRQAGQYLGSFALYGYCRDPQDKHHLIIDEAAAAVVRQIFALYIGGYGKRRIAQWLNEQHIPNPTVYKQLQGYNYVNGQQSDELGLWNHVTVGRILKNRMYLGDMVQGRKRKLSYKSDIVQDLPPEQWVVVKDTHEPIIDEDSFDAVTHLLMQRQSSNGHGSAHALSGKVYCACCKSVLQRSSSGSAKGTDRAYLRCKLHARDKSACPGCSVRQDRLEQAVLQAWQRQAQGLYDAKMFVSKPLASVTKQRNNELKRLRREINRHKSALQELYLDKAEGLLSAEQFSEYSSSYQQKLLYFQQQEAHLLSKVQNHAEDNLAADIFAATEKLNRSWAAAFVDYIEVGEYSGKAPQPLIIHWLF